MARFSLYGMAGIGIAAAIGFVLVLSSISSSVPPPAGEVTRAAQNLPNGGAGQPGPQVLTVAATQNLNKFASVDELRSFLANVEAARNAFGTATGGARVSPMPLPPAGGGMRVQVTDTDRNGEPMAAKEANQSSAPSSYSTTNVQVAGVDEPDFLKNDGKYAYVLAGDKLTIAEVFPAQSARIVAKIGLDIQQGQYLQNMFLANNTLVVMYQEYGQDYVIPQYDIIPQPYYAPKTHALVLDISDRENPRIANNYQITGAYSNARLIGDYVYLVTTSDIYNYRQPLVPKVAESSGAITTRTIVPDVYYFDNPEPYYSFNTVTSINIKGASEGGAVNSKTFMMNPASTLYVSEKSIYIAYQKYQPYYGQPSHDRFFEVIVPLLPEDVQKSVRAIDADSSLGQSEKWDRIEKVLQDMYNRMAEAEKAALIEKIQKALGEYDARVQKDAIQTVVHRIAIGDAGQLDYVARGEVPGRFLNQFSMDEGANGRFRVATTVEYYSPYSQGMYSNVYVLNDRMETVGRLEQLEKGESIYAARFLGDRLYLVTFQRVDPLFVIDLSTDQPKVLGQLKLPGYSTYLHPYDADHVIGIGKDTKDNGFGGVSPTGVKVALFDVSNVANPKLVDDYVIAGQGTDSEALYDHKAFLFDKGKNLLSIPVSTYDSQPKPGPESNGMYVQPRTWRGFYVFTVSPEAGVSLRGTIEHSNSTANSPDYYYQYGVQGSRSFFIDGVLYTVSLNNLIKMNDIETLQELNKLEIGSTGGIVKYPQPLDRAQPQAGGQQQ
jgi:uncharacterized secreted protein with C-terminal beta-propeller domain